MAARGEFALLASVRAAVSALGHGRGVLTGIGDDCAVVEGPRAGSSFVLTTDTMMEGVHFRDSWLTARELGVRAFRAAVSDIAAMGARPRYVLLSLEIPGEAFGEAEALLLARAVASEARRCGATLVGGNVSGGARTGVTVTIVGETCGRPLLRSAAKAGDLLFVTGRLGGAAAGWRALAEADAATRGRKAARASSAAFRRPPLRLDFAAALAARGFANAAVDLSDGLLQDLGHVAEESRVAIRVDAASVPVHAAARRRSAPYGRSEAARLQSRAAGLELALAGGEDYELAFTAPPSRRRAIEKLAAAHAVRVSVIGRVEKGHAAVTDSEGEPFTIARTGFDHLRVEHDSATVRRGRRVRIAKQ